MCNILRSTLQICSEYETVFMFMINYRVSAWNSVLNPLHHDNGEMRLYYVKATFSSCWQFWHFTWTRYAYSCGKNTLCFQLRICPCSILLSCLSAVYVIMKHWLLYCLRGSEEWLFKKHYITAPAELDHINLVYSNGDVLCVTYVSLWAYWWNIGVSWSSINTMRLERESNTSECSHRKTQKQKTLLFILNLSTM